jgi:hypothetical protein
MLKQKSTVSYPTTNYNTKKESIFDQFIDWFRNFLDNAE